MPRTITDPIEELGLSDAEWLETFVQYPDVCTIEQGVTEVSQRTIAIQALRRAM